MYDLKGRFLVAMPHMDDPRFKQTVTYLCDHTEEGAIGLVINQPSSTTFSEVLDSLEIQLHNLKAKGIPVMRGGPVEPNTGFVIHPKGKVWRSTFNSGEIVDVTTSKDILESLAEQDEPSPALVALGFARWDGRQLEDELEENLWLTTRADSEIIFKVPPRQRWLAALGMLGIHPRQLTRHAGHD